MNLGTLKQNGHQLDSVLNIRFPMGQTVEKIETMVREKLESFNKISGAQLAVSNHQGMAPIYTSPETDLVKTLVKSYKEVTGKDDEPMSCPGTTYAKVLPNAVGFGPGIPGTPDRGHTDNEYISLEELKVISGIYLTALLHLAYEIGDDYDQSNGK